VMSLTLTGQVLFRERNYWLESFWA
jgi:hypothetical protein